jgi:hypothetical protein
MTLSEALLILGLAWLAFSALAVVFWIVAHWLGPDPDDGPDGWDPYDVPMCKCGVRTLTPHLHASWTERKPR